MPILLRTQVERTAKAPIPACHARVGSLCDFQDTVERVPAGSLKTGRCAAVRERWQKTSEQDEMAAGKAACGKCGKSLKMVKIEGFWTPRRESGEKAARKQDKAAGSCAPRGGHICPRCGQFRVFTGAFQKQRKTALGRCSTKKSPPFQGKRRGSNEIYEVNAKKW